MTQALLFGLVVLCHRSSAKLRPGGATWREPGEVGDAEEDARAGDGDAEVTLTADVETFQGMLSGDVNPTAAFMTGKLKVDGDMGQAMQLGAALS